MPLNVFGNSISNINGNKFGISLFVQKPYLRSNYIEANFEKNIDLKINTEVKIYLILYLLEIVVVKIMLTIYSVILIY